MNEPSKEAMEKAEELWQRVFDAYRKAPLGTTIDEVGTPLLTIEFTNYQQRVEELEKVVALCLETLTDGEQSEPHAYLPAINACRSAIKSHLAKGVKEEREQLAKAITALEEIKEGKGEYNREPLIHARNTIESMKALASTTLDELRGGSSRSPAQAAGGGSPEIASTP
jgi:multidrug resistance efflux pump